MRTDNPVTIDKFDPVNLQAKTSVRWFVAAMVGAFAFVSYVERMNISVAAALMMPDLHLSATQIGQIFTSFLWGYAIFQVPAGSEMC